MNFQKISQINSVIFTSREIDIISCIINVKGVKKIADILGISPRTVEGHIKNISIKISTNSQEGIKDFVENSPQLVLVRQHYIDLLINKLFISQIAKVALKLKSMNLTCVVNHEANEKLEYIVNCLKLANINIIEKSNKDPVNSSSKKIVIILKENHLLQLKQGQKFHNVIFVCFDKRLDDEFLQKFSNIEIVDCFQSDQIYSSIFKIIELLEPNIDLSDSISNFNKQKKNVINLKIDLTTSLFDSNLEKKAELKSKKRIIIITSIITAITVLIILSLSISVYKNYKNQHLSSTVSVNFLLPNKKILLERKVIHSQLEKIFAQPNDINTAVLMGIGGSGKTTIARNYAKNQNSSVIWELNAETKNSLFLSLEGLAYAISDSNNTQELRSIFDIKDISKKEEQLLLFTQKQLKLKSNWFIVFDNVISPKEFFKYFPYNPQSWGTGKVIITTRDANIKNNNYIEGGSMIQVGELNREEKLQLFLSITKDKSFNKELSDNKQDIEVFLDQIPSFPLDVSVAASYIKETGIQANEYLKHIKESKPEFVFLQEKFLENTNEYSKTRYSIITLEVESIIKNSSDFKDLLLFIALLDSKDIPKELLISYKDHVIVNNFINELKKNSFITNISSGDINNKNSLLTFSIHRSAQLITLAYLKLNTDNHVLKRIISVMENYGSNLVEAEDVLKLKSLQNHSETILASGYDILDNEDKAIIEIMLGEISSCLGNDLHAKKVLEKIVLSPDQKPQIIARAFSSLGNIYRRLGDFTKAENAFNKSLAIYKQFPDQKRHIAKASMYLGILYRVTGNDKKAENAFNKSLAIYEQFPDQKRHIAKASMYLGTLYRFMGNYKLSQKLLEESFNIYNDQDHKNIGYARSATHLAVLYRVIGEYTKAQKLLESSLNIYKQLRKPDHIDIAWVAVHLGVIHSRQGNIAESKRFIENGLEIYKKHFGERHIETARVMNYLAEVYILSKETDIAEELVKKAFEIFQSKNHYEAYSSLEILGDLYASKVNQTSNIYREKAIDYFQSALHIANMTFGNDSEHILRLQTKVNNLTLNDKNKKNQS